MEVHWPGRWCRTACTSRSPGHWGSAHPIRSVQYPWTLFSLLTGRSHPTPSPESTRQTSRDCSWKMHSPGWLRDCLLDFVKKERKKKTGQIAERIDSQCWCRVPAIYNPDSYPWKSTIADRTGPTFSWPARFSLSLCIVYRSPRRASRKELRKSKQSE